MLAQMLRPSTGGGEEDVAAYVCVVSFFQWCSAGCWVCCWWSELKAQLERDRSTSIIVSLAAWPVEERFHGVGSDHALIIGAVNAILSIS